MMNNPNYNLESLQENISHTVSILKDIALIGCIHKIALADMRNTCAFQEEINSGSSKYLGTDLNKFHSSKL